MFQIAPYLEEKEADDLNDLLMERKIMEQNSNIKKVFGEKEFYEEIAEILK